MKNRIHTACFSCHAVDRGSAPDACYFGDGHTIHTGELIKDETRAVKAFNRRVELVLAEAKRRGVHVADLPAALPRSFDGAVWTAEDTVAYLDTLDVLAAAEQAEMTRSAR